MGSPHLHVCNLGPRTGCPACRWEYENPTPAQLRERLHAEAVRADVEWLDQQRALTEAP